MQGVCLRVYRGEIDSASGGGDKDGVCALSGGKLLDILSGLVVKEANSVGSCEANMTPVAAIKYDGA